MAHPIETAAVGAAAAHELMRSGRATIELGSRHRLDIAGVYDAARRFFAGSEERRQAAALPFGCGYVPFGREHSGDPDRPDQVDCFAASSRTEGLIAGTGSEEAVILHAAMMRVFGDLEALAEAVAGTVAAEVVDTARGGSPSESLQGGFRRWSRLEVHRARHLEPGALINEPHEDGHLLTFAQADAPGLEIELDGTFMPMARSATHMTVMPGSAMTLMTGGAIQPLRHQVRAHPTAAPRLSLLFFADLDPVLCEPWRVTAANVGLDIGAHVAGITRRFGVDGFERD